MTDDHRQFDRDADLGVSPEFAEDLGELFTPDRPIPACVDRAVAEAARRHLACPQRRPWLVRWAVPATAAAAILVGLSLWWLNTDGRTAQEARPAAVAVSPSQADVDRNGKVNILDAFTLARHIESRQPVNQLWDLNGDGLVDRRDVDTIAMAAVRLNKGV
jgi:hypothetical protein